MDYFQNHHQKLNLGLKEGEKKSSLRECQMGAFWAASAHFTASNFPALIVMPTGSGKTAVMMLLAFGLSSNRVLIITPAVVLRDQTAMKFSSLDDLIKAKVLPENIKKPNVHIQEGRITSEEMWNELRKYDVVVATPHTISPEHHKDIVPPPDDLFDLVFFDEAHHTPAQTWDDLLKRFKGSKCIFLTATPFRQDKREMLAHIAYNYPLGRAIDDGIYRPIEYHSISALTEKENDILMCEKAKELLTEEKKKQNRTKILIRTNTVRKTTSLISLYKSQGINVKEVNYQKSLKENEAVLDAIKNDELDGVICIGMLGEGLDIPELKIAVLHNPPQSLPFTLQFIGRLSRPANGQIGDAHVIANPDNIKGKMRELYWQNARWRDLVPKLADEAVGEVAKLEKLVAIEGDLYVSPMDVAPFFSARLYKVKQKYLNLWEKLELGDKVTFTLSLDDNNFLVLITESENKPPWVRSLALYTKRYDLHIYYYHQNSKTLFESTTSDAIATEIRSQIIKEKIPMRCGGKELLKVMKGLTTVNYLMVGLANVVGSNPSLPAYKILMGKEVQGAVRPSEGRVFAPGHALARISRQEIRGIGNSQGRVWAMKRASLIEYKKWCNDIGSRLNGDKVTTLPGLEFLPSPERVTEFPDQPIAMLFDYSAIRFILKLIRKGSQFTTTLDMSSPEFELKTKKLSEDKRKIFLRLYPNAKDPAVALSYNVAINQWTVEEKEIVYEVKVDTGYEVKPPERLTEFLSEYPPSIYLGNGGVIINGELYQAKKTFDVLPDECILKGVDWSRCDIKLEFADRKKNKYPINGKLTVHDWLENYLITKTSESAIILKDHARGEIADFVLVEPESKNVALYHCKSSRKDTASATISDLNVLEQALRSVNWIRKSDILSVIVERCNDKEHRPNSKLVKGTEKIAKNLATNFRANEWNYQVIIVQPGLDCKRAVEKKNTNTLLLNCFEWLKNLGASLLIMGHSERDD